MKSQQALLIAALIVLAINNQTLGQANKFPPSGNVGIGTTNPARKLHLSQNANIEMIMEQSDAKTNFKRWNFLVAHGSATMPSNFFIRQLNDAGTDGNIPFSINGNGNVGIGATNPARKLHLSQNANIEMIMEQSDAKADFKRWNFVVNDGSAANPSRFYIRQLNDAGTGGNVPFIINGNGNVGIGATNPARKLHLSQNANIEMIMEQSDAKTDFKRWNFLVAHGSATMPSNFFIRQLNDAGTDGNIPFSINGNGNVGIGTTSPTSKLHVIGSFTATGTKAATVETPSFGKRKLYSVESATVRFNDEGTGKLQRGTVKIEMDPVFIQTVEGELTIHLTSYGPTSLYVEKRGTDYFVVKSLDGKDVEFAWQVSALRRGYADVRLERGE